MALERFIAPVRGILHDSAAGSVPKDQAQDLRNFLVDRPGKLVIRGRTPQPTTIFAADTPLQGLWIFDDKFLFQPSAAGTAKRWVAGGATNDIVIDPATAGLSGISVRLGDYAYGKTAYDLRRWTGTTAAPTIVSPMVATNGSTVADVAAHQQRLFVAGGMQPGGGTQPQPAALWYSDVGGPLTLTVADWQDDVSGLINRIDVGSPGDPILAIESFGRQLLIFKQRSIWALVGDGPSTWSVRQIASNMTLRDRKALTVFDDLCLFVTVDGPVLYDGAQFDRITGLEPKWAAASTSVHCTITRLPNDYVLITGLEVSYLLHLPTRAWIGFTSAALDTLDWVFATEIGVPYGFDGTKAVALSNVSDYTTSGAADIKLDATTAAIDAAWTTRLVTLGLPTQRSTIRRLMIDHLLTKHSDIVPLPKWEVSVVDGSGEVLSGPTLTPGTVVVAGTAFTRIREFYEINVEATDAWVEIAYVPELSAGVPPVATEFELHDLWLEFEPSHTRGRA